MPCLDGQATSVQFRVPYDSLAVSAVRVRLDRWWGMAIPLAMKAEHQTSPNAGTQHRLPIICHDNTGRMNPDWRCFGGQLIWKPRIAPAPGHAQQQAADEDSNSPKSHEFNRVILPSPFETPRNHRWYRPGSRLFHR